MRGFRLSGGAWLGEEREVSMQGEASEFRDAQARRGGSEIAEF